MSKDLPERALSDLGNLLVLGRLVTKRKLEVHHILLFLGHRHNRVGMRMGFVAGLHFVQSCRAKY